MKASEMIEQLELQRQKYGDLDVHVYHTALLKFAIEDVSTCSNRDHILVKAAEKPEPLF